MPTELMKAVIFDGSGTAQVKQIPVPKVEKGWLLIAPVSSG